jgi:type 1 glutamine amidotransferase
MPKVRSIAFAILALACAVGLQARPRLLVFSKIAPGGYFHQVIPLAAATVVKLGGESGFDVDTTTDSRAFTRDNLARYQAVFFNHTYGDVFDTAQQSAFQAFIRKGGGFAGIHASSYVELDWPWYRGLVGAYFKAHPAIAMATLNVEDRTHISTSGLPAKWSRTDEWYDFDASPRANVHVLISIDEKSYQGGLMGADHPMAWYHDYDGGRAWYSALGHTPESYSEKEYLGHLRGGILYALGQSPTWIAAPVARNGTAKVRTWISTGSGGALAGFGGDAGGLAAGVGFLPEGWTGAVYSADGAIKASRPRYLRSDGIPWR